MIYCKLCIIPSSRPHIVIDKKGVCNACRNHQLKKRTDWKKREREFRNLIAFEKSLKGYSCVIPVSGGKDSTWQVIKCLEYGLRPLTVTWAPSLRTKIGYANLRNLISLGVDNFDISFNPNEEKKTVKEAFLEEANPCLPMHSAIFSLPVEIVNAFKIPLILWGENTAFEYGGSSVGPRLDIAWLQKHGASQEFSHSVQVFMSYYFKWDPVQNFRIAEEHGFKAADHPVTGTYNFADIDDPIVSVHHWLKWYKFGFTRAFDNLSTEIRNGRFTRDQAIEKLTEIGEQPPLRAIDEFCQFIDISSKTFDTVCEKFRNRKVWKKEKGVWKVKDFLIKDWNWF